VDEAVVCSVDKDDNDGSDGSNELEQSSMLVMDRDVRRKSHEKPGVTVKHRVTHALASKFTLREAASLALKAPYILGTAAHEISILVTTRVAHTLINDDNRWKDIPMKSTSFWHNVLEHRSIPGMILAMQMLIWSHVSM
jgi:hypothetical protein